MRRTGVVRLSLLAAAIAGPALAQEGRTIWGEDYNATVRAMKQVAKALGVKSCLHCHVKEEGKIAYEVETPNKQIARRMKFAFVDSLATRGQVQIELPESKHRSRIAAAYISAGDSAGIHLTVVLPPTDKAGQPRTFRTRVDLPEEGSLSCETCHGGRLHFVTQEE